MFNFEKQNKSMLSQANDAFALQQKKRNKGKPALLGTVVYGIS